jgi:hypothetical protein
MDQLSDFEIAASHTRSLECESEDQRNMREVESIADERGVAHKTRRGLSRLWKRILFMLGL